MSSREMLGKERKESEEEKRNLTHRLLRYITRANRAEKDQISHIHHKHLFNLSQCLLQTSPHSLTLDVFHDHAKVPSRFKGAEH